MNIVVIVRFIHGIVTGALAALLIWNINRIKRLKCQKAIMYVALKELSNDVFFDYDPDASIPDDYDGLTRFCLAARSTNRKVVSKVSRVLKQINDMDGRDS